MTPTRQRQSLLTPRRRRVIAVPAIAAVLLAAVITTTHDDRSSVLSALPGATGQPAPTGPTGGDSGGGMGGPPFPMQPPDMPGGPSNGDNGGAYPAPDQGNGVSIYNSDAPKSPGSQDGYQKGTNNPQQLQPANGTQPPDYDAPLQTAAQPSLAPTQAPRSAAPQQRQPSPAQQPEDEKPSSPKGTQGPTALESSVPPTSTNSPNSGSDQEQSRDNFRCLNAAPVIQFNSMRGTVMIGLIDGGQCNSCDTEKPREKPNNCGNDFVTGVGLRPASPGAEGGLESIMVYPTQKARMVALNSGGGVLFADTPPELKQLPATLANGSEAAFTMWGEIACHAQASNLMSPSDPSKSVYDRIQQNPDSIFQQFMCHFYGAQKKFWDADGGYAKPSWNLEWARPAEGTFSIAFGFHPCN
ncbi:hypothetical protein [Mycolicibacterium sp. lyk4-40-TYG-92]|uniref:hypothetical protein n=1 Tax=Mycolicibacterium sp. lyk4-40-TYG-92 TaxID=3040295 RepID=UPI00254ABCFF|nr:hypothetical protein [Mycolicibacterium sp. lyk4-40-TYG-92]